MKTKSFRIPSVADIETIPGPMLRARIAAGEKVNESITNAMIADGRGYEYMHETRLKTDALSLAAIAVSDALWALRRERNCRNEYHGTDKPISRK